MRVAEAIDAIEACETLAALRRVLQAVAEAYGFASYAYLDGVGLNEHDILVIATTHQQWGEDYKRNNFVFVDPVLTMSLRSNVGVSWSQAHYPKTIGRKKSGAARLMEAARDHGFEEGLAIPVHHLSVAGRYATAVCGFFWKDRRHLFGRRIDQRARDELQLILVYWSQTLKAMREVPPDPVLLEAERLPIISDRERAIVSFAARGFTAAETGEGLCISTDTVEFHWRNVLRKLSSRNKTEAAVKALKFGLIDI